MTCVLITIDTPDGPLDLSVPAGATIDGLLTMLAPTIAGTESLEGWTLTGVDRASLDASSTLEEAGILDGTRLALTPARVDRSPARPSVAPSTRIAADNRAARIIPDRMSEVERMRAVVSALLGRHRPAGSHGPIDRMMRAWEWTDHGRRLTWLLTRPRIRRSVFVGVLGHRSDELAEALADTFAMSRIERVVLVDGGSTATISRRLRDAGSGLEAIESGLRRRDITSIERDLLFGRTDRGTLVVPVDPTTPVPDAATVRRLCDSLPAHAGLIVMDCGSLEAPNAAVVERCDQIVASSTGATPRFGTQTIAAVWGGDELQPERDLYARHRISDDPMSIRELAVIVAGGWAALDAATPIPAGL